MASAAGHASIGSALSLQLLPRMVVTLVVAAAALLGLAAIMPSFDVSGFGAAVGLAAVGGIVNSLLWPLIVRVALPLTVLTLGVGALLLNGAVTLLVASVVPGVELDGLGSAVVLVLGLTAFSTAASALLAIDDDGRFLRPALTRAKDVTRDPDAVPGVLFLEIDGLAHSVLRRALRDGNAPAMASWLREGGHRLHEWETDWSSQTGACQAGILHGSNEDMPAFRWWDIAFALVRSREHGPVVLGAHGEHLLESGELLGVDPLAPFGPTAARHVARTDGFAHCPDIVVNSTWWPETEEVAAFEELVGSHGGMGGPQAHPFVLAPAAWPWPAGGVVGAEAVHHLLRGWLARLGHEAYAEPVKA
jgi:uncharacterized membrane protein YvlD (DUF360 family)